MASDFVVWPQMISVHGFTGVISRKSQSKPKIDRISKLTQCSFLGTSRMKYNCFISTTLEN